jgi:murein DD-endopeptidase MepM/ murein hydrolase activator NlpD
MLLFGDVTMNKYFRLLGDDIINWKDGWHHYIERRLRRFAVRFETQKDVVVDILMARRGTYQRPFLHLSLGILLVAGVTGAPIIANAYPGGVSSQLSDYTPSSAVISSLDLTDYGVQTQFSEKPRDKVETYIVKEGDTLARVADKYGVSIDTIKWASDMKGDSLSIGQYIQIPPVTGIVHKVAEGETVQSIAKKYKTDAQKIVNFPFNDFTDLDTFSLQVGQLVVVPDGVQITAPPIIFTMPPQMAFSGTGKLVWPTNGLITQYPIWYHLAYDIANPSLPGVMAADDGVAVIPPFMRYGYGNHIIVDHGGGFSTLYGHLSEIYVKTGDHVARGQVIGRMGSTGRSTGTHLHFETRINGTPVNPSAYFK